MFDSIESAIKDFECGKFVVVMDDEDRENEGDLIIAAQHMTTEKMAFMIRHTRNGLRGYICVPMTGERLHQLQLPLMVPSNTEKMKTAYAISTDFIEGTTTGISAHDRALTARKLADPSVIPSQFSRPGHILPLHCQEGGVLARKGHTEASIDLCIQSNLLPCAVICEIINEDGSMARRDACAEFAKNHGFKIITIADLIKYITEKRRSI